MSDSATQLAKDDVPDSAASRGRWLRYGVRVPLLLSLIHISEPTRPY